MEITEHDGVIAIMDDERYRVPEADASDGAPFARFRALASRFCNGPLHAARRDRLERLLAALEPAALGREAELRARAARAAGVDAKAIAAHVPVATLAEALGFAAPEGIAPIVATLAESYPTGAPPAAAVQSTSATDEAAAAAMAAARLAGAASGAPDGRGRPIDAGRALDEAALRVQLLVQAHAATAGLILNALRLEASAAPPPTTRALLANALAVDPPVPTTRRVAPDGATVVLRLDARGSADAIDPGEADRLLAFGAGPRRCPAPHQALAIAAAVVDVLRATRPDEGASHAVAR